jgi:hypothetical protein
MEFASRPKAARSWLEIAQASQPLDVVAGMYRRASQPFARWSTSEDVGLNERPVVVKAIKRHLLTPQYMPNVRLKENADAVEEWLESCYNDSEQIEWFRNDLIATHRSSWRVNDPVLQLTTRRFEIPSRGRPFWDSLPKSAIDAVELWLKDVELTQLLRDDEGPRVRFWREFLPQIKGLHEAWHEAAVFICFDTWFAVQFRDPGVATYMFPRSWLTSMARMNVVRLIAQVRAGGHVGRYVQQGTYWQENARHEVRRVMRGQWM